MKYKVRKGIILTQICGEYLLVAAKEARTSCPAVLQINETAAEIWKMLQNNMSVTEIQENLLERFEVENPEIMRDRIEDFISAMIEHGYLTKEESFI